MSSRSLLVFGLLVAGCSNNLEGNLRNMLPDGGGGGDEDAAPPMKSIDAPPMAVTGHEQPAPVEPNPTAPDGLGWSASPAMGDVQYLANRDSVKLILPKVAGAVDYRAILLGPSINVSSDGNGAETVLATTMFCAGYLQRNTSTTVKELLNVIEVPGVTQPTRVVIEAIDTSCPFTGVIGAAHEDLDRTTHMNPEILPQDSSFYSVFTEAEMVKTYGVSIFNGQGSAASTGKPAPATTPKVLARTTVKVTPAGNGAPPTASFFDDFSVVDPPRLISDGTTCYPNAGCNHPFIDLFQNKNFSLQAAGMDKRQYFYDRGQLHTVMADGGADGFASSVLYPRKLAHVGDTNYLHVTYEVNSDVSDRRYWWISVCGADQAGQTIAADGSPTSFLNPNSSLQLADGDNPNTLGFGCFMVFPKDGNSVFPLPLGDGTEAPPETEVRVLLYKSGKGVTGVNIDPDIYKNGWIAPSWFRSLDGKGNVTGPMLDANNTAAPTTHFDLYVRHGRVVLFVDGKQKLCNDFDPSMTIMKEAMVGFGQVLYHTSAEHNEMSGMAGHSYMHHVHENLKYFDRRDWDNLGFDDDVQPPGLNETACYRAGTK